MTREQLTIYINHEIKEALGEQTINVINGLRAEFNSALDNAIKSEIGNRVQSCNAAIAEIQKKLQNFESLPKRLAQIERVHYGLSIP